MNVSQLKHLPTEPSAKVNIMRRILLVEDDSMLASTIELYLRNENYQTDRASDGLQALEFFRISQPDLIILDLGLPKLDGLEVLKWIRERSKLPILVLTARSEEIDELLGLGLGADNYLIKPVSARKLLAHVNALLRRTKDFSQKREVVRLGTLELDTYRMQVSIGSHPVELTPTEFRVLQHLAITPGRAISRSELYDAAMPESDALERAIDIHITNIRRKLHDAGLEHAIDTVRGFGYRLRENPLSGKDIQE